ncbi:MAG: hypothetical protein IJ740_16640 [Ruminococcus sp.]|nr:hypothetical protein [Ruminococcus sp.]
MNKKYLRTAFFLWSFFIVFKILAALASYFDLYDKLYPLDAKMLSYLTPVEAFFSFGRGVKRYERIVFALDIITLILIFLALMTREEKIRGRLVILSSLHTATYMLYLLLIPFGIIAGATGYSVINMAVCSAGLLPAAAMIFLAKGSKEG